SQTVRDNNLGSRANELYMDFLNVVTEHVGKKNDVQFYAEKLNVSTRYLAQVTRRIANKSPKMIIDEKLVKKIELLLKTTERNVQEIAYECGFSSQAHLANYFKKLRGVSPTGYRKKY
ncbi:MAG: AraC family transcriptional regulator, partial [Bacteroidaceae bacterium]|nr:AraC family transcriptional regulator [Bacteroidaceae bacterium]